MKPVLPTSDRLISDYIEAYRKASPNFPAPEVEFSDDRFYRITTFGVGSRPIRPQELVEMTDNLLRKVKRR